MLDHLIKYAPILAVVFSVYVWWRSNVQASNQVSSDSVRKLDHRVTVIEETLKNVPTHADMESIRDGMTRIGNEVREMKGEMKGMYRTVKLIEELLLRTGGKAS